MSLTNVEADFNELKLAGGNSVQLTFHDNTVILDLPNINEMPENKRNEIIEGLNELLQDNGKKSVESLSFLDKIGFILDRSKGDIIIPSSVDIVTRTSKIVVSKSCYQADGDITSIVSNSMPRNNRDFLYQVHLLAIKLYMKKWRNNVLGLAQKVRVIIDWINRLQAYASVISLITFMVGLFRGQSSYMMISFLPIIIAGILSLIKNWLKLKL